MRSSLHIPAGARVVYEAGAVCAGISGTHSSIHGPRFINPYAVVCLSMQCT